MSRTLYSILVVLVGSVRLSRANSLIPINTFTDNQCAVPSTTATNVSVPLDTCIVTVGMESFHLATTPCAGGGATSVQQWGFTDSSCVNQWEWYVSYGGGCHGAITAGNAFGSILLSCKNSPTPEGTSVTLQVGPVASSASSPTSDSGSSSSSSSSSNPTSTTSTTSTSSYDCSGWSCLSPGEKIGIIVALAVGIPPILIGLYMCQMKKRKHEAETAHGTPMTNSPFHYHSENQAGHAHTTQPYIPHWQSQRSWA